MFVCLIQQSPPNIMYNTGRREISKLILSHRFKSAANYLQESKSTMCTIIVLLHCPSPTFFTLYNNTSKDKKGTANKLPK